MYKFLTVNKENMKKLNDFKELSLADNNKLDTFKGGGIGLSFEYFPTDVCDKDDKCSRVADSKLCDVCLS